MLPWSVTATVSIPSSLTFGNRSFTRIAPSSREYCVCKWRCVNPLMIRPYGLAHATDTPERNLDQSAARKLAYVGRLQARRVRSPGKTRAADPGRARAAAREHGHRVRGP